MRLVNSKHGVTSYGSKDMSTLNFKIEKKARSSTLRTDKLLNKKKASQSCGKSIIDFSN